MRIRHTTSAIEGVKLNMTPMIDVVFQLLIFFCLTFKVIAPEGDFNVRMPKLAPGDVAEPTLLPPFLVKLTADERGQLKQIVMPSRTLNVDAADAASVRAAYAVLRQEVIGYVGKETGPQSLREKGEAEIETDENLHYRYVIDAVTHMSGYFEGRDLVKLLQSIRFTPSKRR
jgi:biopolymer transport protein ExbD